MPPYWKWRLEQEKHKAWLEQQKAEKEKAEKDEGRKSLKFSILYH